MTKTYSTWRIQIPSEAPFVVVSMFTRDYLSKAERLVASLQQHDLAYALIETPSVHRSISSRGNDDLSYCKPRLIAWALREFGRPILYIDADCEVRERPQLIYDLCTNGAEFAIYNWLFDRVNDAWVPDPTLKQPASAHARYWRFSHCVADFASDMVACSGCVQLWRAGEATATLLGEWQNAITTFAGCPDDECLDFAFNISLRGRQLPHTAWLPKEYARYSYWIYARPVINHPDFAASFTGHASIGKRRFDATRLRQDIAKSNPFPRACVLDVDDRIILVREPGGLTPVAKITIPLYL